MQEKDEDKKQKDLLHVLKNKEKEVKSRSRLFIGQRVEKDGVGYFYRVDNLPEDKPAVLFLGGNYAKTDRSARGYLSSVKKLFLMHNLDKEIGLYSVVYDFNEENQNEAFNPRFAYDFLLQKHFRNIKVPSFVLNEETRSPSYIEELFNRAFLYRISDKEGKRLSEEEACRKMRKLTVVAHCHGAYTFLKLEEKIQKEMKKLGYSLEERDKIQHELLCVAHASIAPLGVSQSTMISFLSARDIVVDQYNFFSDYIHSRLFWKDNQKLAKGVSYFPKERGEFFLTPKMGGSLDEGIILNASSIEHDFYGYDFAKLNLCEEGKLILKFSGNAIINGVLNSLEGRKLPSVKNLVCGKDKNMQKIFDQVRKRGEKIWDLMPKALVYKRLLESLETKICGKDKRFQKNFRILKEENDEIWQEVDQKLKELVEHPFKRDQSLRELKQKLFPIVSIQVLKEKKSLLSFYEQSLKNNTCGVNEKLRNDFDQLKKNKIFWKGIREELWKLVEMSLDKNKRSHVQNVMSKLGKEISSILCPQSTELKESFLSDKNRGR